MTGKIVPVIMAGGKGTRLWPLSRSTAPKQFIRFVGDRTLFQGTLQRVADPALFLPPIIVTNEEFRFLVAEQAREEGIALGAILLEPEARNTAPAIAAATQVATDLYGDDALVVVLASDHEIDAGAAYLDAMRHAAEAAAKGRIATFGITPHEPATGYGYIQTGEVLGDGVHAIARFVEKPVLEKAKEMVAAGGYLWNSGMFMFRAGTFISELAIHAAPVLLHAREAVAKAQKDLDFTRLDKQAFGQCPNISVDYAVMEKTKIGAVVPSSFSWSDLGSWDSVHKVGGADEHGNVAKGRTTVVDTRNSLIMSHHAHVAVQGLDNVAVIASEDAIYVGRLDEAQKVGDMVKLLARDSATRGLTETHPTTYRPWGGYTSILNGDRFQVKRIFVLPGKKLSLQKHHHRSEHWIGVKGTGEVTIGDQVRILRENESVYIPQGEVHRLANPGKIMLELIEVQTGSYLGEDDIIRIVDEFGRQ